MSMIGSVLILAAAQGSPAAVDVAREELVAGRDAAAIAAIMANEQIEETDPARLINLGVAHARRGETDMAKRYFQDAAEADDAIYLETVDGEWIAVRRLANRALAMLERGAFAERTMVASR